MASLVCEPSPSSLSVAGPGAVPRERERHAVQAQAMEQAHPKRAGAFHPNAAVADGSVRSRD